ncbi:MAG TPA: RNA polymerase sigma factor, partial [Kofleriaceae bacterium]|nr:RNA polymerase sigma factor [Kofleriaceae bacterium]
MDGELIERCRAGDREAFGRLVERHQGLVFGVALAATGDTARAEDVAQEAFVVAWRELGKLREVEKFPAWVAGIARNLARTQKRSWARRQREVERAAPAPEADEKTPFDEVATREDRALLEEALAAVPSAHREALVLYYLEGESIAEVSRRLGISEALMKQRLSRGRRALRGSWAERLGPALARARPGAAFTAAVVASVAASAVSQAAPVAAGKVLTTMSITKKASIVAAVAAVGGG